jgi:hypothetical protein
MTRFDQRMTELNFSILHENERERGDVEPRIRDLEKRLGLPLPSEYREFLTSYGGATFDDIVEAPITEPGQFDEYACPTAFFGFYRPRSKGVPHSLDLPDNIRHYRGRVPTGYIPIAQAIGGNLILLNVVGKDCGKIYYWDHETSSILLTAESFAGFLEALAQSDSDDDDEE